MQSSIKVVVIDGHTLTRYGLMRLVSIDADITVVGECGLAAEAPALVESARPDVVVLDVALPDADGLQLARELRDRYAELGIVVLTAQAKDDLLFRALETGVSAFVDKTAPNAEVLVRDPARRRGGRFLHRDRPDARVGSSRRRRAHRCAVCQWSGGSWSGAQSARARGPVSPGHGSFCA